MTTLPSDADRLAEGLIELFERKPELLAIIERWIARRRGAARFVLMENPDAEKPTKLDTVEKSIETCLRALSDPRDSNSISREARKGMRASNQTNLAALVEIVSSRLREEQPKEPLQGTLSSGAKNS
jgi:hypothetical protein